MGVEVIITNSTVIGTGDKLSDLDAYGAKRLLLISQESGNSAEQADYMPAADKNFHHINQTKIQAWRDQQKPLLPEGHSVVPAEQLLKEKGKDFLEKYMKGWAGSTFTDCLKKAHDTDGLAGIGCRLEHSWVLVNEKNEPIVCLEFFPTGHFMFWGNTTGLLKPEDVLEQDDTAILIKWLAANKADGKEIIFKGFGAGNEGQQAGYAERYESTPLKTVIHGGRSYMVLSAFCAPQDQFNKVKVLQLTEGLKWLEKHVEPEGLKEIEALLEKNKAASEESDIGAASTAANPSAQFSGPSLAEQGGKAPQPKGPA